MIRAEPILHIAVPVEFRDALLEVDVAQVGIALLKVCVLCLQMFETARRKANINQDVAKLFA